MSKPTRMTCPQCGARLQASTVTPNIRCSTCQAVFPATKGVAIAAADAKKKAAVAGGVLVLAFIGLIISMQPVTMITGSTMVWIGVVITAIGLALAFFMSARPWVRVVVMLAMTTALFNACGIERQLSDKRDDLTNRPTRSAKAPTPQRVTPSSTCSPAPSGLTQLIGASLGNGEQLQDVFAVTGPDGMIYFGANIIGSDGVKVSSADVWLAIRQQGSYDVYSLSGDARRRTAWPDGRDLASAGDDYGNAVQDCTIKAERARNTGGR